MPTLRTPVLGSRVITPARVMYGPPSSGQQMGIGRSARFTSAPRSTVAWQGARPPIVFGGNLATSASCGSMASLPNRVSGTLRFNSAAIRSPISSRHCTPSASAMRRSEPNRLTATGRRAAPPPESVGCWNRSAGPPPGDFMQRSAISVISRFSDTGRSTRTSIPAASIAPMKARRLSSAMMDGADPAGEQLEGDVPESRGLEPPRQRVRLGKLEHRRWQVGIGVPMFRHRAADGGQQATKVEEVEGAEQAPTRRGELEHHEPRPGLENPRRLREAGIQVGQVADAEGDHGAVELRSGERQGEGVGGDGPRGGGFAPAPHQHRYDEVRADHGPPEP